MAVFRAFIAIQLPAEVQNHLRQISDSMQEKLLGVPIRWVPVDKIHLTLKFLGDVSQSNMNVLSGIIKSGAEMTPMFEISVGGLGAFPSESRPRVLWIGVTNSSLLSSLQRHLDLETARLGYQSEERTFAPHLTLGRVSRNASGPDIHHVSQVLGETKVGFLGAARVTEVNLFKSELKPGGAEYTILYTAVLREH